MAQIEEDYSKRMLKLTQSLNIERSTEVNKSRLLKMKERNDCMKLIRDETEEHMLRAIVNPENMSYRNAIKNLIIQSMIKLLEKELVVRCRKEDVNLLKALIPECEQEYEAIMKKEVQVADFNEDGSPAAQVDYKTRLILNQDTPLRPEEGGECGGVILSTTNDRIVCNNTLKSRLDLCFEELLPHIRSLLFPHSIKKEVVREHNPAEEGHGHGHKKH